MVPTVLTCRVQNRRKPFLLSVRPDCGSGRNEITRYIEAHNIQTRLLFSGNLIRHPCFDQIRGTDAYRIAGSLENTDFVMNNSFWIGVYPGMTGEMMDVMIRELHRGVEAQNV